MRNPKLKRLTPEDEKLIESIAHERIKVRIIELGVAALLQRTDGYDRSDLSACADMLDQALRIREIADSMGTESEKGGAK